MSAPLPLAPPTRLAGLRRQLAGLDRVILAIVTVFAAVALLDRGELTPMASFVLDALTGIAPFLLAAVAIAAYAKASGADNLIADVFQGNAVTMIALAALFGGLSPFCSCGVIPLVAALLAMGVPLAAVMAFWVASPLMDPTMFFVTASVMGLPFAIGKTIAAVGIGAAGGYLTLALGRGGWLSDPLRPGIGDGGCAGGRVRTRKPTYWAFWHEAERRSVFAGEFGRVTLFLARWMTLAFALEFLMTAYIPAAMIEAALGSGNAFAIPTAVLVGIPAYLNGYAALGLVSGLVEGGMASGAAMAFLLAGGVTSIPAAIAVWALARPPVLALYIFIAVAGALISGLLFQFVAG
ncbi:MAG: permease [Salinarimonas sp.]|nr:permease [Salinarimonas sp.]